MNARAAAHAYLDQGISILPIHPHTKRSIGRWKHWQSEPMSHDTADLWWGGSAGEVGIGIITGSVSGGLNVLDIEPEHVEWFAAHGQRHGQIPKTARVETARGGLHIYCHGEARCGKLVVEDRIVGDVRGRGGYVVAPPSRTTRGQYVWCPPFDHVTDLAPTPLWAGRRTARGVDNLDAVQEGFEPAALAQRLSSRLRLAVERPWARASGSELDFAIVLDCIHQGATLESVQALYEAFPICERLRTRRIEKGDSDYLERTYMSALDEFAFELDSAISVRCHRLSVGDGLAGMGRRRGAYIEVFDARARRLMAGPASAPPKVEKFLASIPMLLGPPHDGDLAGEWLQFLSAFGEAPTGKVFKPRGIARAVVREGRVQRWIRKAVWREPTLEA